MLYINVGRYYVCDRYERQKIKNSLFYSEGKMKFSLYLQTAILKDWRQPSSFLFRNENWNKEAASSLS